MKRLYILFLSVCAAMVSSCNIDEVITEPMPESVIFEVCDYTPAPGQFIGDMKTAGFDGSESTAQAAIAYAQRRLDSGLFVSLGAFGGYITVRSSCAVANGEGYDFIVAGNAFANSSEPGIVWVMQDENGNGVADDTWYELAGSETGLEDTIAEYEVTYYRPVEAECSVAWSDNLGGSGEVEYLGAFHSQASYYPQWITAECYTLKGTRLKSRSYDKAGDGSQWINPAFDWGYADNASAVDGANRENLFDISNARNAMGEAVVLEHIDFIKVQSAIQQQCGRIGEVSTDVAGFKIVDNE